MKRPKHKKTRFQLYVERILCIFTVPSKRYWEINSDLYDGRSRYRERPFVVLAKKNYPSSISLYFLHRVSKFVSFHLQCVCMHNKLWEIWSPKQHLTKRHTWPQSPTFVFLQVPLISGTLVVPHRTKTSLCEACTLCGPCINYECREYIWILMEITMSGPK